MTNTKTSKTLITSILAVMLLSSTSFVFQSAQAQTTSFITIDLTGQPVPNDYPFGIVCGDPTYAYVTINQGLIAQINKSTRTVTLLTDSEGASAGRNAYLIDRDPNTGKLYYNERDNGELWKKDPVTGDSQMIPLVEQITGNPDVTYPFGFSVRPRTVAVNENPSAHGVHTYDFSIPSFGGVVYGNSNIWVGISYTLNFDIEAETNAGVTDLSFSGLAKVNPTTNAVTRIAITGSQAIDAMSLDSADTNILWISDKSADKIFKFNIQTETLVDTITLVSGSDPRGISTDATNLYVALNKPSGGNSQILQILKSNTATQTTIDTTASNTNSGTFTTFIAGSFLLWTDQSGHIGTINLSNNAKTVVNTSDTNSNHFGCLVGSQFWFAGQGSAKVGTFDLGSETVDGGGDGCNGDCVPPTLGVDANGRRLVSEGFTINEKSFDVNSYFTPMELQTLHVGKPNNVILKIYENTGAKQVAHVSFCMDIPPDKTVSDSNACILWDNSFDQKQTVSTIDKNNILSNVSAEGTVDGNLMIVSMDFTVDKPLVPAKFGTAIWDINRASWNNFFNHGLQVTDDSPKIHVETSHDIDKKIIYEQPKVLTREFGTFADYKKMQSIMALEFAKSAFGTKLYESYTTEHPMKSGMYDYKDRKDNTSLKSVIEKEIAKAESKARQLYS